MIWKSPNYNARMIGRFMSVYLGDTQQKISSGSFCYTHIPLDVSIELVFVRLYDLNIKLVSTYLFR